MMEAEAESLPADWQPPVPEGYNDANRAFLQALMSRGTMTFVEAKPILASIVNVEKNGGEEPVDPESITQEVFDDYIRAAREAVLPLDYDIRSTVHQVTRERVWALINTQSDPTIPDPTTEFATSHTPEEIAFIKRMLDAMFETYNTPRMEVMCVTEMQALKVARPPRPRNSTSGNLDGGGEGSQPSTDKGLKHSEVLALLPNLVAEGWLEKSKEGFYSLSPRALLELWPWLNTAYNDYDEDGAWQRIKYCEACKEIVTVGQRCSERDCPARIHDICLDAYWRSRREKKCPKCERVWDGKHFVGERAVTSTEAFQKGRRGGRGRRSDLVDSIIAQNQDEEDEGGEEEQDEDAKMGD